MAGPFAGQTKGAMPLHGLYVGPLALGFEAGIGRAAGRLGELGFELYLNYMELQGLGTQILLGRNRQCLCGFGGFWGWVGA